MHPGAENQSFCFLSEVVLIPLLLSRLLYWINVGRPGAKCCATANFVSDRQIKSWPQSASCEEQEGIWHSIQPICSFVLLFTWGRGGKARCGQVLSCCRASIFQVQGNDIAGAATDGGTGIFIERDIAIGIGYACGFQIGKIE